MREPLLQLCHVSHSFSLGPGYAIQALQDVSLTIHDGETVGLIGESGCGKSTLARVAVGLYMPAAGDVLFEGKPLYSPNGMVSKTARQRMHLIFQDSDGALDPHMTAASSIRESLRLSHGTYSRTKEQARIASLLHAVGLEARHGHAYPAELSGGQRQRVAIARCLGAAPRLIIADEPIASLDVSIQAQIINLLMDLQEQQRFSMLFIAHDLAVVRHISDRTAVMYGGRIVEIGPTEQLFSQPVHPYTQVLLASILYPDPQYERKRIVPVYTPEPSSLEEPLIEIEAGHFVRIAPGFLDKKSFVR